MRSFPAVGVGVLQLRRTDQPRPLHQPLPRLIVPAGGSLALVGGPVTLVSEMVASVSGPLPSVSIILGSVQHRGTLFQSGSGRLQCLLGGLGSGLGRSNPGVVDG